MGITVYGTETPGTGGSIRGSTEDFVVDEILSDRYSSLIRDNGRYAVYRLVKNGIDTGHALSDIFRTRRLRLKALGLKDAFARTTQYVCSNGTGSGIEHMRTPRYEITLLGYTDRPITKKAMVGNKFRIRVRGHTGTLHVSCDIIPNHFGYQRFGSRRPVTHLVGKAVLLENFDEAIRLILYETSPHDRSENTILRRKLAELSYDEGLEILPRGMDTERTVLRSLHECDDTRVAFMTIPLYLRRLYVQAYQSYLFNLTLSGVMHENIDSTMPHDGDICFDKTSRIGKWDGWSQSRLAIPLVGYSYYKKTRFHGVISNVLEQEEVTPRMFYTKHAQELSSEGGFRQAILECTDFSSSEDTVEFVLSRGSYATMVMREIMKPRDPITAGF